MKYVWIALFSFNLSLAAMQPEHKHHRSHPDIIVLEMGKAQPPTEKEEMQTTCCCSEKVKITLISSGVGLLSAAITAAITLSVSMTHCKG